MADTQTAPAGAKVPVWFWIVSVLFVLWNAVGVFDYVSYRLMTETYLAAMGAEQQAYMTALPAWLTGVWAAAVFAAFIGAILFLARMKWAMHLAGLSIALFLVSLIYHYGMAGALAVSGVGALIFSLVILAILVVQFLFARWALGRGILR